MKGLFRVVILLFKKTMQLQRMHIIISGRSVGTANFDSSSQNFKESITNYQLLICIWCSYHKN